MKPSSKTDSNSFEIFSLSEKFKLGSSAIADTNILIGKFSKDVRLRHVRYSFNLSIVERHILGRVAGSLSGSKANVPKEEFSQSHVLIPLVM